MTKTKFLIAASLSLALAGCGAMGANTSVYSTNQPVVERTNYAIDVNSSGSGDFAPNEKARLTEWLSAMNLRYGDRIAIDFGSGYPSASATETVSKMASEYGIILADTAPVTAGHVAPGTMRIVLIPFNGVSSQLPELEQDNRSQLQRAKSSQLWLRGQQQHGRDDRRS